MPPHVTILYPFVDTSAVDLWVEGQLRAIAGRTRPFRVRFTETGRFERVLYLAPRPAEQFVRLTQVLWARFPNHPPYGGNLPVVPHLTISVGPDQTLDLAASAIRPFLPVSARIDRLALFRQVNAESPRWEPLLTVQFR